MGSNIDLSSVIECITEQFPWNIYAIVIFGSAASAETYQKFADIDLCVLEHFFDPFLDRRLEKRLQKFPSEIAVSHYPYWYFCKLGTMLAFDVGKSGVVIYGPRNVLSPIQDVRMHPYEALKIFFNHSVVKLLSCVSKDLLKADHLSKEDSAHILYCCTKALEGICAALLVLRNNYKPGNLARARIFSGLFRSSFPLIYDEIPELSDYVRIAASLRTGSYKFEGDCRNFWFKTKGFVEVVLPFLIDEYFGKENSDPSTSILRMDRLPKSPIASSLFAFRLLQRTGKFPPIKSFVVQPVVKVHIASALLLLAVNIDGTLDDVMVRLAKNQLSEVYPLKSNRYSCPDQMWEHLREISVMLNELGIVSQIEMFSKRNSKELVQ